MTGYAENLESSLKKSQGPQKLRSDTLNSSIAFTYENPSYDDTNGCRLNIAIEGDSESSSEYSTSEVVSSVTVFVS